MSDYSQHRANAAKWMYDRKDRPVDWWRWWVLTQHNDDPDTLGLDDKTASWYSQIWFKMDCWSQQTIRTATGVLPKSCSLCYESPTAREGKEDFR